MINAKRTALFLILTLLLGACSAQRPTYVPAPMNIDGFKVSSIRLSNGDLFVPSASPGSQCKKLQLEIRRIEQVTKSDLSKFRLKGRGESNLADFYLHLLSGYKAKCS